MAMIIGKRLSNISTKVSALAVLIILSIGLYILMLIIYKGEYVCWINGGPSYEEAKLAGSEKRKEYARAHLDKFFKMMLLSLKDDI